MFKTRLYIVLVLCLIISSCKSIWFQGKDASDSEDGYYWEVEADTVNSYGTRYSEKYLISLNIMNGDTVVFYKKIRSDTAYVFSDSLSVDPTREYSVAYFCNWQGARPDYALKMSVGNIAYDVGFYSNDIGHLAYKEKLKIISAKIPIRFGVCEFSQDLK